MTVDSSDDDDDARKPAARPTGGSAILSSPLPPSAAAPPPPTPLATERTVLQPVEGELAFLVTHWLSGFARSQQQQQDEKTRNHKDPVIVNGDGSGNDNQDPQHNNSTTRAAALAKIHTAAASLAEAFAALGTFGSAATKPSLVGLSAVGGTTNSRSFPGRTSLVHRPPRQQSSTSSSSNRTFADMKRTWSLCESRQLEHLLQSSQSATAAVAAAVQRQAPEHFVQASVEARSLIGGVHESNKRSNNTNNNGRALQDAIVLAENEINNNESDDINSNDGGVENPSLCSASDLTTNASALQAPICLTEKRDAPNTSSNNNATTTTGTSPEPCLLLGSSETERTAAAYLRKYLSLREQCFAESKQIRLLNRSLQHQQVVMNTLAHQRAELPARSLQQQPVAEDNVAVAVVAQLEEIRKAELSCERVVSQIMRQLPTLEKNYQTTSRDLISARLLARKSFDHSKSMIRRFRDPVVNIRKESSLQNRTLMNLCNRQCGFDRSIYRRGLLSAGRIRACGVVAEDRKALLYNRFSHAATINTHLSYPVYCLRFDRTGRYFVSGADDYLAKVFCLAGSVVGKRHDRLGHVAHPHGAVLVCTLKGHAGVINDIGVSSDNCFLATASADGDCRVWGLKDGCPVAILRGHLDGANMVSWSTLTPYRLITAAADGLARVWDVREACLKRYGRVIGSRPEYQLQPIDNEPTVGESCTSSPENAHVNHDTADIVPAPPIPIRAEGAVNVDDIVALPGPPNPPLNQLPAGAPNPHNNDDTYVVNGQFIANDFIDKGVKLVSKLQHGATLDDRLGGPGTRARRSAVNVICVAICPYGGHFATGSDDGICRVWQEDDNSAVERIDARNDIGPTESMHSRPSRTTDRLLLTLKGHLSAITDLHYSKHGDRILTASQRDGVVRIWSWNSDPAAAKSSTSSSSSSNASIRNVSHILLKLTNSNASVSNGVRHGPPSRPNRSITSAIACDVAVWTCDDTKVITSQSELLKQNGNDIVVGSQYLFLWDSYSGHCLLGIPEAHSMPCPVVLPHPFLPSIICSAGADGVVRLWDWDSGKCIFLHTNIADFGPIETRERGTNFGYLDGEFSPDGTTLVLTDDSGRLTVLDSSNIGEGSRDMVEAKARSSPDWMKEQYFSNDYYDLFYDVNGYCVERGSERPPHLAPTGARCSHSGAPFSAGVNETLKCLRGPMPLCNNVARWHRQVVRECARKMTLRQVHLKGNLNRQYEATSTILVRHGSKSTSLLKPTAQGPPSGTPQASRSQNGALAGSSHRSSRHLSSNYRWSDDADIEMADDEPDHESDDEDFELTISNNGGSRARGPAVVDSESEDLELEDDQLNPSRSSSRHRLVVAEEEDESGDEFDEYVSMNNSPTGPFMADYDTHFFRMPSRELGNHVQRHWLHRNESSSSHGGRKLYTPQVGDVVVYIPQAHLGSLTEYPGVQTPPWQHWPDDATWPVVQCYVRNIRYRFPYKDYKTCNSVIAKLTLEATGIPELSTDRIFGWPSPTFTTLTKCHVFELNLFVGDTDDFLIPQNLYMSRLQQLERVLSDPRNIAEVEAFYADSKDEAEDAEYLSFRGKIVRFDDAIEANASHPSLFGSGFGSLGIVWDQGQNEEPDQVSPWDVSAQDIGHAELLERPKLSEDEKKNVRDALKAIGQLPGVKEFFVFSVDLEKYSDYATRVEVPMDLNFLRSRLEADYYSTRYSVVADVRLIHTNCKKYNGDLDELSDIASDMLETFEGLVLNEEERGIFHKYDMPIAGVHSSSSLSAPLQLNESDVDPAESIVQRRSQRCRSERSLLENLPESAQTVRNVSRQKKSKRASRNRSSVSRLRLPRNDRSVLESRTENIPTLEHLSNVLGSRSRGRTTRSTFPNQRPSPSSAQRNVSDGPVRNAPRRAARAGLRNSTYLEVPSDNDSSERRESALRARRAGRAESRRLTHVENPSINGDTGRAASTRGIRRATLSVDEDPERLELHQSTSKRRPATLRLSSNRSAAVPRSDVPAPGPLSEPPAVITGQRTTRRSSQNLVDPGLAHGSDSREGSRQKRARTTAARSIIDISPTTESTRNSPQLRQSPRRKPLRSCPETDEDNHGSSFESDYALASRRKTTPRLLEETSLEGSNADDNDDNHAATSEESDGYLSVASSDFTSDRKVGRSKRNPSGRSHDASIRKISENDTNMAHDRNATNRIRARHRTTYEDPSSSEFGSDVSVNSSLKTKKSRLKHITKKRKVASPRSREPEKRAQSVVNESHHQVDIGKWPEISLPHISKVTIAVLQQLREMDENQMFSVPVVESYPELKESYLQRILEPMDFRTIEEDRLNYYLSICDLQQDLILVFRNCMAYNDTGSPPYNTASLMMGLLEDTFRQVCDSLRVRILHHRSC